MRLLRVLVVCCAVLSCSPYRHGSCPGGFSFIVANDLHIGVDGGSDGFLSDAISEWNRLPEKADFVALAGDCTQNGLPEEFDRAKKKLSALVVPFYTVPGNHDLTRAEGEEGKKNYRDAFGEGRENYLVEHKGFALLFLDLSNGTGVQGTMTDGLMQWVREALAGVPDSVPIVVVTHFPLHPQTPALAAENVGPLLAFLDSRKVLACFSGHYHGRWHGVRNGTDYYVGPPLSPFVKKRTPDSPKGYLLVTVCGQKIATRFVGTNSTY